MRLYFIFFPTLQDFVHASFRGLSSSESYHSEDNDMDFVRILLLLRRFCVNHDRDNGEAFVIIAAAAADSDRRQTSRGM